MTAVLCELMNGNIVTRATDRVNTMSLVHPQDVRRTIELLVPGQVVEVRALEASTETNSRWTSTLAGYFDTPDALVKAVSTIQAATGIYITLQPCDPELLHRAYNRLKKQQKDFSTPDKHILRYTWLPIDCDPDRPTGISSTDEEHDTALGCAQKIRDALTGLGWPAPIQADSGNGAHLLYRIDLEIAEKTLVQRVLEGIAAAYPYPDVKIDQTVYNPARIWKLYGTRACKGDNTTRRPHRMSRFLDVPGSIQIVTRDLLEGIAAPAQEAARATAGTSKPYTITGAPEFDIAAWITRYSIDTYKPEPYEGGTRWTLKTCPFCGESDRAAIIWKRPDGKIVFVCKHNRCTGKRWQDLRTLYEPNAYNQASEQRSSPKVKARASAAQVTPDPQDEQADAGENDSPKVTQADILIEIAEQEAEFFTTPGGICYARIPVNGHTEVHPLGERGGFFKLWLVKRSRDKSGFTPNDKALTAAMMVLTANAVFSTNEKQEVFIRLGYKNGKIYLDLANNEHEVVEISVSGWKLIKHPPVCFRRTKGMSPLPRPQPGGSLDLLQQLINADDDTLLLMKAWAIGCLHPHGPYAILGIHGERGAAKTSATEVIRSLIDPSEPTTRRVPDENRTLTVAAANNHILALDNLSSMPTWLSDALCRISTGTGDAYRQLYTDGDEAVFSFCRPIIFNGIEEVASRGDLLDRCILVNLPAIPDTERKRKEEFDRLREELHPLLLGALLAAASMALRDSPTIKFEHLPRMADFAAWVIACEPCLTSTPGRFMEIYSANREESVEIELEASPVAVALRAFMEAQCEYGNCTWKGHTGDLYTALCALVSDEVKFSRAWPRAARMLNGKLKRLATSLRAAGLIITQGKRDNKGCPLVIQKIDLQANSVANLAKSVANEGVSVAKSEISVAKCETGPLNSQRFPGDSAKNRVASDESVANFPIYIYSENPKEKERREGINGKREESKEDTADFASLATLATPKPLDRRYLDLKDTLRTLGRQEIRWPRPDAQRGYEVGMVPLKEGLSRLYKLIDSLEPDAYMLAIQVISDLEAEIGVSA